MPRKSGTSGSEGGRRKRTSLIGTSSAAYPTSCPVWREAVGKDQPNWHLAGGPPDPKADGRLRPLRIASLEDKIVQRVVVEMLGAVYEVDFRGFSYGFVCPERGRELEVGRAS
jgi:hypothetical protein